VKAGAPVFYRDTQRDFDLMEQPNGRKYEIRFIPGTARERNYQVLRELGRRRIEARANCDCPCGAEWFRKEQCYPAERFRGKENLLGTNAIARQDPMLPERAAIPAGREVIRRSCDYLRRRERFAIETTRSGNWTSDVLRSRA